MRLRVTYVFFFMTLLFLIIGCEKKYDNSEASKELLVRIKSAIEKNEDLNGNYPGRTRSYLHRAVGLRNEKAVNTLLDNNADIEIRDQIGATPLHRAAQGSSVSMVKLLLKRGADIEAKNRDGSTPLFFAVRRNIEGYNDETLLALLDADASVNTIHEVFGGVVAHAAYCNNLDATKILVSRGADVNAQNADGMTALHMCAGIGHPKVAKYLLENGADVTIQDKEGFTAIDWTDKFYGNLDLNSPRGKKKVKELITEHIKKNQ